MRIFITGIQGVLGSTLAKELRYRGHEVFGCGRRHSADENIIRADVAERRQLSHALTSIFMGSGQCTDLLFHFAGEFGRKNGQAYQEDLWRTNCLGTRNVIDECVLRGIPMVFASSSEAYGLSELYNGEAPLREDLLHHHPPQFHNEYALTKYTNERQIYTAVRNDGLKATILRFFNVYGPPEQYTPYRSVVCQFAYKMLNDMPLTITKNGRRSHLWIGDWVNTVANVVGVKLPGTPVFNIGGTENASVEHLYLKLLELMPGTKSEVTYQEFEPANSASKTPDNTLAEQFLGHKPQMPLEDGLRKTIQYLWDVRRKELQ